MSSATAGSAATPARARPARAEKLYTRDLLALAVRLANYPLADDPDLRGSAKSRTCGSAIELGCVTDSSGKIERIGSNVVACAVGQAAAAVFLSHASGLTADDLQRSMIQLDEWLAGNGPLPDWPEIEALAPARDHPARHGAIALPWRAACDALCKDGHPR